MHQLSEIGDFVTLKLDSAYEFVVSVNSYTESIVWESTTGTLNRQFRWSIDDLTYSSWISLTDTELQKISILLTDFLYVHIRYTLLTNDPVTINSVELIITTNSPNPLDTFYPYRSFEYGNENGPKFLVNDLYRPYTEIDQIRPLYEHLANSVSAMFGHDVMYARYRPQKNSRDVVFMESTLYDVDDPVCVRVLVPDNVFPDMKYNFNMFGVDFDQGFEIIIMKAEFEKIFGKGVGPQKRDIVFFDFAGNRYYEVGSSYLYNDFMMQRIFYKVSLVKYTPRSNAYMSDELSEAIDNSTLSMEELFEEPMLSEAKKITNKQQFTKASVDKDLVRKYHHPNISIKKYSLENYFTIIGEYVYDMSSLIDITEASYNPIIVEYVERSSFDVNDDLSYTAWISPQTYSSPTRTITNVVVQLGDPNRYIITLNNRLDFLRVGDEIELWNSDFDSMPLFGIVTDINTTDNAIVTVLFDSTILSNVNTRVPTWTSETDLKFKKSLSLSLFDGYNSDVGLGYSISIHGLWAVCIRYNLDMYYFTFDSIGPLDTNRWYAIVVNMSNTYKEISVNLWRRIWESSTSTHKSTSLMHLFESSITGISRTDRSGDINYSITSSPLWMTNIRLMSKTIEVEEQDKFLNQQIVKDANYAIIIDNAMPKLGILYFGNSK